MPRESLEIAGFLLDRTAGPYGARNSITEAGAPGSPRSALALPDRLFLRLAVAIGIVHGIEIVIEGRIRIRPDVADLRLEIALRLVTALIFGICHGVLPLK